MHNDVLYRQVNQVYASNFDLLLKSGLYDALVKSELMVKHSEVTDVVFDKTNHYKTLKPELIPFISYPYEWCFSQLKTAALLTLKIQKTALKHGMSLKDASAYNVQFIGSKPIFIDTLSFEKYDEKSPWVAYRQFCQHFLAPLALMSYVDVRFGLETKNYLDGIPLDLASKLLPTKSKFNIGLLSHIHLHAGSQSRHAADVKPTKKYQLSNQALLGLLDNLQKTINGLELKKQKTEWQDYYKDTNYTAEAEADKEKLVKQWLKDINPKTMHDLGANTGKFSRLAPKDTYVISSDVDPMAVEANYTKAFAENDVDLLPLLIDLTNPSPALGWANQERQAFLVRSKRADTVMCLALIHHLAISNNLPLENIAKLLSEIGNNLIIEFISKDDSNVKRLLTTREDIFDHYNQEDFEKAFDNYFVITEKKLLGQSARTLYFMKKA